MDQVEFIPVGNNDLKKEEENDLKQLKLPSSVFQSDVEEKIGLLNRAAPKSGPTLVGMDSDLLEVLETLDDEYAVEEVVKGDELKDEFDDDEDEEEYEEVEGELEGILAEIIDDEGDDNEDNDEEHDDVGSLPDFGDDFETRSKFTEYSMSSSVIPRSEQLEILDDKFEKFFDEYEEENTGALDMDEISGFRDQNSEIMKKIVEEYQEKKRKERVKLDKGDILNKAYEDNNEEDEDVDDKEFVEEKAGEKWDCESILSTYSNIYHHPKLISEKIQLNRSGLPKDVLGKSGLTASALKKLDRFNNEDVQTQDGDIDLASRVSELSVRNKHETLEEKRTRKQAVKALKRERRIEKKSNTLAFKEEKMLLKKAEAANNRNNIRGPHLL